MWTVRVRPRRPRRLIRSAASTAPTSAHERPQSRVGRLGHPGQVRPGPPCCGRLISASPPAGTQRVDDVFLVRRRASGQVTERPRDSHRPVEPADAQGPAIDGASAAAPSHRFRAEICDAASAPLTSALVAIPYGRQRSAAAARAGADPLRGPTPWTRHPRRRTPRPANRCISTRRSTRSSSGPDNLPQVAPLDRRGADAVPRIGRRARAQVRRQHELEPGGIPRHAVAAGQPNLTVFQGVRSASSALVPISAHSSRNSTPRCARLTAPGRAIPEPPPTSAATLEVWCGATNGGLVISGASPVSSPATE